MAGPTDMIAVAAGTYHSVGLEVDGTVWAWGYNFYGQLGDGTYAESHIPVHVAGLAGVRAIGAGQQYTFATGELRPAVFTGSQG